MNSDQNVGASAAARRERRIVFALSVLAAIHVFIYCAAFPLFNIVDEIAHFDLVVKYCQQGVPRGMGALSDESLNYIVLFSTVEYSEDPTNFPGGKFPPPLWTQPMAKILPTLLAEKKYGRTRLDYEATQPPLYYELAAIWWRLGHWCGMHDSLLPYWLRFLNVLLVPALVWIGFWTAKLVFPEHSFVRLSVPALLAFMPQSVFYSISNDILSPICFGLAFICLFHLWRAETPGVWLGVMTGLALTASFLNKVTNLPMVAVSGIFIMVKVWKLARDGKLVPSLPSLAALFVCSAIPAAIWIVWCKTEYGDFTGSALKTEAFGWTAKPFNQWWHHPIFTPWGVWTFLSGNLSTFWQGEMRWHNKTMLLPGTDFLFTALSLVMLVPALPAIVRPASPNVAPWQCQALRLGLAGFVAGLGFSALLSLTYDFHDFYYPSRDFPYFTSGRLLLGALVPVLLILAYGMDRLLDRFGNLAKFVALGSIILMMLVLEIATDYPVFCSPYNLFHLL